VKLSLVNSRGQGNSLKIREASLDMARVCPSSLGFLLQANWRAVTWIFCDGGAKVVAFLRQRHCKMARMGWALNRMEKYERIISRRFLAKNGRALSHLDATVHPNAEVNNNAERSRESGAIRAKNDDGDAECCK
jgi:hypothetical protein